MKTLTKLIVPLLLGVLAACDGGNTPNPDAGPVTITPKSVTVKAGDPATFTATVEGAQESKVLWSVEGGATSGTITSTGVYTAPAQAGTYKVVATNAVDTSKKDSAQVTVTAAVVVSVSPANPTVATASSTAFTATVTGASDTSVTWSVEGGAANGTLTAAGVYTAPTTAGVYTVTATSVADPSRKASTQVRVEAVAVSVAPASSTVDASAVVEFTATVTGPSDTSVTWSVEGGDTHGTITASGIYTAPSTPGTFTVVATSVADPSKKGTATVSVRAVSVSLAPQNPSTHTRGSVAFYATVTGTSDTSVTWSVEGGATHGTITSSGIYTAPTTEGSFTVTATSVADPTKKASTTVTVAAVGVTVSPATASLDQGATATFTASVTGASLEAVTWSVEGGATNGTITSSGIYTAPHKAGTFTVVATSVADPGKKGSAQVTVAAVGISIAPSTQALEQGASTTFTATVTGTTNTTVLWLVEGTGSGTITSAGVYTAPRTEGTFTVTATSVADPSKKATAQAMVGAVTITLTPTSASLDQGATLAFSASVTGTSNTAVTWSVEGTGNGTISSDGLYTAPHKAGTFTVVATSVASPSQKSTAQVTVADIAVSITPASASLEQGATQAFSVSVTGTSNTAVTWSVEGGDTNGTITSAGVYTAPHKAGTFTVKATSAANPARSATATVTVADIAISITPASGSLEQGATLAFSASVTGATHTAVTWSVEGTGNGTISSDGVYTAPLKAGTFTVKATSAANPAKSATATVTVADIAVSITPASASLQQGATQTFSASVTGTSNTAVTWSVEGSGNGTISHDGVYTAPGKAGTFTVKATSAANPAKSATATVTVADIAISITPASGSLEQGATLAFSASVTGTSNTAVTWSVEGTGNGTISSDGVYTAPLKAGTFTVKVASAANPAKSATATVTVADIAISITPASASLEQGATQTFSASVTGTSNTAVTWSVEGTGNGTISSDGVYTAPGKAGTFTVKATSAANPAKSATATVAVADIAISITPASVTLQQGTTQAFNASVTGAALKAVTWSVEGSGNGTISSDGVYTAPLKTGTFTVKAASVANPAKTATATVTVPAATGAGYQDPTGTGWKLVKNASASSGSKIVLDLVGPTGGSGRGVDLTLAVDPALASWVKVSGSDAEPVVNQKFALGSAPQLIKGIIQSGTLKVGVFQKGHSSTATAYSGGLISVALELKLTSSTPAGTVIPISVVKAHALPANGDLTAISVAVGTITAQ